MGSGNSKYEGRRSSQGQGCYDFATWRNQDQNQNNVTLLSYKIPDILESTTTATGLPTPGGDEKEECNENELDTETYLPSDLNHDFNEEMKKRRPFSMPQIHLENITNPTSESEKDEISNKSDSSDVVAQEFSSQELLQNILPTHVSVTSYQGQCLESTDPEKCSEGDVEKNTQHSSLEEIECPLELENEPNLGESLSDYSEPSLYDSESESESESERDTPPSHIPDEHEDCDSDCSVGPKFWSKHPGARSTGVRISSFIIVEPLEAKIKTKKARKAKRQLKMAKKTKSSIQSRSSVSAQQCASPRWTTTTKELTSVSCQKLEKILQDFPSHLTGFEEGELDLPQDLEKFYKDSAKEDSNNSITGSPESNKTFIVEFPNQKDGYNPFSYPAQTEMGEGDCHCPNRANLDKIFQEDEETSLEQNRGHESDAWSWSSNDYGECCGIDQIKPPFTLDVSFSESVSPCLGQGPHTSTNDNDKKTKTIDENQVNPAYAPVIPTTTATASGSKNKNKVTHPSTSRFPKFLRFLSKKKKSATAKPKK